MILTCVFRVTVNAAAASVSNSSSCFSSGDKHLSICTVLRCVSDASLLGTGGKYFENMRPVEVFRFKDLLEF